MAWKGCSQVSERVAFARPKEVIPQACHVPRRSRACARWGSHPCLRPPRSCANQAGVKGWSIKRTTGGRGTSHHVLSVGLQVLKLVEEPVPEAHVIVLLV